MVIPYPKYSQPSPCRHLAITDTPIIWTAANALVIGFPEGGDPGLMWGLC